MCASVHNCGPGKERSRNGQGTVPQELPKAQQIKQEPMENT